MSNDLVVTIKCNYYVQQHISNTHTHALGKKKEKNCQQALNVNYDIGI